MRHAVCRIWGEIHVLLPISFDVESATIRDALRAIQRGSVSAALAVTAENVLVGVVTDGDIRRALLDGSDLSHPVQRFIRRNPVVVAVTESRSSVLDLMHARGISMIPMVDPAGKIAGVHLLQELLGRVERPNLALVLAGGRGTRLQPVTAALPKPMVTVAGRPILERIVNHLVGYGIKRIVLAIGHMGEVIEDHFGDGLQFGCDITYLRENPHNPLGTGGPLGSLSNVSRDETETLLVLNGDLVTQFDVAAMLAHHEQVQAMATIGAITYTHEVPFGVLDISGHDTVTAIVEKPLQQKLVNAGIYALDPQVLPKVPRDTFVPMTQVLSDCIDRGERVSAWALDGDWIDIGRPQDLAKARGQIGPDPA